MAPAGGKDTNSNKKDLNNTQNVLHHVGMVVNGFEIQKLIGKSEASTHLIELTNQIFVQARASSLMSSRHDGLVTTS